MMAGLGVTFFAFLDATTKVFAAGYPLLEIVGLRYGAGAIFAALIYLVYGDGIPSLAAIRRNLPRSAIVLCTACCFFTAIVRLPLVEAITLTFLAPLLMALLGRLILKEPVGLRALIGIFVGLAGVIVIARGQAVGAAAATGRSFDLIGLLAALGCAFSYALGMVLMRQQTARDSLPTIVLLTNTGTFLLAMPIGLWQWQPILPSHWLLILMSGFFGTCAHLCMAWAYARAPAGRLGILEYSAFIWAILFGFYIFGEIPSTWTLAGAALIMLACIYASLGRKKTA